MKREKDGILGLRTALGALRCTPGELAGTMVEVAPRTELSGMRVGAGEFLPGWQGEEG